MALCNEICLLYNGKIQLRFQKAFYGTLKNPKKKKIRTKALKYPIRKPHNPEANTEIFAYFVAFVKSISTRTCYKAISVQHIFC